MKKLLTLVAAVVACGSLFAEGNQITWKGDGETPRWSDGSNWVGGVAPEKGDIAVIPEDTTAWASHRAGADGDRDIFNNLAGIRLDGANAVFIIDVENNGDYGTAVFDFKTPVSGNGHLDIRNTANNDRWVTVSADNTGFTGTYDFTNAFVKVGNEKAIASGCRVNFSGGVGQHKLQFCAGVFSNDVHVVKTAGTPAVLGKVVDGVPVTTNLGVVVVEKVTGMSVYVSDGYYHTISNLIYDSSNTSSTRLNGTVYVGAGGFYGRARLSGNTHVHFCGPLNGTDGYNYFGYTETGHAYIHAHAVDVLRAVALGQTTIDLGGYDQPNATLTTLSSAELTTDSPATLTWVNSNTSGDQTMGKVEINGPVSIVYNMGTNGKKMTFGADGKPVSGTMSGAFTVKKSNVYFSPYVSLPKLKKLASTSRDKYNPSRVYVQTADLGPARLRLEAASEYGTIDVAEGIQLDVLNFLSAGAYVKAGVYGSAAAHEAHPELVDADHVLATLAGTGTVKVRLPGEPGMMLLVR